MFFKKLRTAVRNLNPSEVRELASRPVNIGLMASSDQAFRVMEGYFCPAAMGPSRHFDSSRRLHRIETKAPNRVPYDIEIWDASLPAPGHAFVFRPGDRARTVREILQKRPE